jgi:deoxyribose-phosphate aldolase
VPSRLAPLIDHTLLKPDAQPDEIDRLCAEARKFGFAAVCVQPVYVNRAARALAGSGVKVATVVAFPHGASHPEAKAFEARRAVADGAAEVDMVANLALIRSGDTTALADEIAAVVEAARPALVKVILETAMFTPEQNQAAAQAAVRGGAAFVKTSTGYGPGGATVADVALLRQAVGPSVGVKASGGIRTREQAEAMLAAGANRLGCSASVAIVSG